MQKQYIPAIGTAVVVIGLAIGGFLWWHGQQAHNRKLSLGNSFDSSQAQASAGSAYSNGQDISLEPTGDGGLSAGGPAAGNLGQLSPGGQNGSGGSGGSGQGQSSSSGSSGSSSAFNPANFAQYSKYQNNPDALMADVQAGTGTALSTSSGSNQATVYYKGWLTDGTLFDESRADSSGNLQPFTFTEGQHQVIKGWEEGLLGMKAGGTRLLVIPPAVGYGSTAQGTIPPNSVLVFEVQLLSVH